MSCHHTGVNSAFSTYPVSLLHWTIPCLSHPSLPYPLSWPRVKVRAHRGHMSSEDTLSCTNSSGLCPESAADYQIHTSCGHVFLDKMKNISQNSQEIKDTTAKGCKFKFSLDIFSPNASLMWPLRPHFVRSSTGLNQTISSDAETNHSKENQT